MSEDEGGLASAKMKNGSFQGLSWSRFTGTRNDERKIGGKLRIFSACPGFCVFTLYKLS